MRKWLVLFLMGMTPLGLFAARLVLRDGTVIRGEFIGGTPRSITFQDERGLRRQFDLDQIQTLDFGRMEAPAGAYNARPPAYRDDRSADRYDPNGPRFWATIPASAEIEVRTDQGIDSRFATEGATFPATIVNDVLDENGNIAIPRGAPAQLIVRRIDAGGTLNNGDMILDLQSVQVNGRWRPVDTTDIRTTGENGLGVNRRTGEMVGGGAALGTLLGAIAGGGKGAAIGALAGGAVGAGATVATKGHEIRVPAETVLRFRLERPLHLREE